MRTEQDLLDHLRARSTPYSDPLAQVRWSHLTHDDFWLPESAISLYGCEVYETLDEPTRRRLSHYEFVYFISGALWLEGLFMERIARATLAGHSPLSTLAYRLHELREEAGHSLMFIEFLQRAELDLPRRQFARPRLATLVGRLAPFESTLFWIAVLIGEEVPDRMNRLIRRHRDTISLTVHDLVSLHMIDEARHMAHARDTVSRLLADLPAPYRSIYRPLTKTVFRQFVQAFYFPTADVYRLAGLPSGTDYVSRARNNPHRAKFVDYCVEDALTILRAGGLVLNWR
ncbi:MAG: diiron oxygenase [Thioalkalivibrionaceae bacterium]